MTAISVVVCAHDERRWSQLCAALRSLELQSTPAHEVVVVVDHNDALLARVRAELPVRAVANTLARGLGGARNSGVAAVSGSVVAFLDDDAMASPQWLARLAAAYADPAVAGAGGSAHPLWDGRRPPWFPPEFDWVIGCSYLGMPETVQEVRNLFGCNMSFRRSLLEELGGFRLGYGCDETELCIRLRQRWPDKRLLYIPEASVQHHVSAQRMRLRRFVARCYFEGGSKAVVSHLVGRTRALSEEYRYTRGVLPAGVRRGVGEFLRRGRLAGLTRAAVIGIGLLSTVAGYVAGSVCTDRAARRRGWAGEDGPGGAQSD